MLKLLLMIFMSPLEKSISRKFLNHKKKLGGRLLIERDERLIEDLINLGSSTVRKQT